MKERSERLTSDPTLAMMRGLMGQQLRIRVKQKARKRRLKRRKIAAKKTKVSKAK